MRRGERFDIRAELYDWSGIFLNAIAFVVLLFAFVACIFSVSGPSMMDTLQDGDMVFVSGLFYKPERGDIVMFSKPGLGELSDGALFAPSPYVKRIIAVGGDVLDIDYDTSTVYLNGQPQSEAYILEGTLRPPDPNNEISYPVYVPEGYVFCMGDNRNISQDSRSLLVGLVDERYIIGRALFRILPFDQFGAVS